MRAVSVKLVSTVALLLLFVLAVPSSIGCSAGATPIKVKLGFSEPPVLNKTVTMTAIFTLPKDSRFGSELDVTVRMGFHEGFEIVDGKPEWSGNFYPGDSHTIRVQIKATKVGTWKVWASAGSQSRGVLGYTELYASISEQSANISDRPPVSSPPTPKRASPPPGYPTPSSPPSEPAPSVKPTPSNVTILPEQRAKLYYKQQELGKTSSTTATTFTNPLRIYGGCFCKISDNVVGSRVDGERQMVCGV